MHCLVVPSGPADKQETCSLFFVEAINAARERIWITTPYLIPDEAVFSALRLAVLRGVDVRILIPSRRDHRVVFAASKLYAYDSLRAGIRIFRYQPGFLHQKVVLIDSVAAAIGSANLDNRSFRLNFEIMVLTVDRGFAKEVEAMLLKDFARVARNRPQRVPPGERAAARADARGAVVLADSVAACCRHRDRHWHQRQLGFQRRLESGPQLQHPARTEPPAAPHVTTAFRCPR